MDGTTALPHPHPAPRTAEPVPVSEISDSHARGLRRNLFAHLGARVIEPLQQLPPRIRALQWPHRGQREANAAYHRAREVLYRCGLHWSERRAADGSVRSATVMVYPRLRRHADGHDEPVLRVRLLLLTVKGTSVTLADDPCGRISHHAIERMYQRLRTNDHAVVLAELRSALGWTRSLRNAAMLSRRAIALHQLPVPTEHGALRCIVDPDRLEIEARTFTVNRPDGRVAASLQSLHRWMDAQRPVDDGGEPEAEFVALMRDPANRWWRQPYSGAAPDVLG